MIRHWLATAADQRRTAWIKRFDPKYWTVDFPRPMLAAVTTVGADGLAIDVSFQRKGDLAGLIWESVDRWSHPLLAYATARDYRGTTLAFRWQSSGVIALNAVNGPVLTIEGRDAAGTARTWYVRLWNYAVGAPDDAAVALDFDAMDGGFLLPGEADPVWAGDIDRMFVSLAPPGYDGSDTPLAAPLTGRAVLSGIVCDGPGSMLRAGDAFVPPHGLAIASGYDDSYNQTPERLIEGMFALGYRGTLVHYVGMSHFPALGWDGAGYRAAGGIAGPAAAWHADFCARAVALGFAPVLSLSFELFDAHCPDRWAQRDAAGGRALTGYVPPSTLLSPCSAAAMGWLHDAVTDFAALMAAAGAAVRVQIGEPWWWVQADGRPCLYDAATTAAYLAATGQGAPAIADPRATLTAAQRAFLDWCGVQLSAATLALRDAVRAAGGQVSLLIYTPQIVRGAVEMLRANLPAAWASPAFDVLQSEDYELVTGGDVAGAARARAMIDERFGYAVAQQQYFAGFAVTPADWSRIVTAAAAALGRGIATVVVWAWPQVARDGFTAFRIAGDETVPAFHDVRFPLELGYGGSGGPQFSTQVVVTGSGFEQRNSMWADARLRYDAGIGVRSEDDLAALVTFFRARRGQAHGFRFSDPLDRTSAAPGASVTAFDQRLGTGDGVATRFALVKRYGEDDDPQLRRITRPVAGTVVVGVAGAAVTGGWSLADGGFVDFTSAPAAGAAVTAGFQFDVPVRFAEDRIDVSIAHWRAGDLPSVPLVEIREDGL